MQDNDGWELIGSEGGNFADMEKVPKWVRQKTWSMDMRRRVDVQHFYALWGRRYSYRIYAYPQHGPWSALGVYRKRRDRSRHRRRSRGSSKALAGVLVVAGAVLLAVFLAQIL